MPKGLSGYFPQLLDEMYGACPHALGPADTPVDLQAKNCSEYLELLRVKE